MINPDTPSPDPEIRLYTERPLDYARIARQIDICEMIGGCKFGACDLGRHCGRHSRSAAVAARYDALRARWKKAAK